MEEYCAYLSRKRANAYPANIAKSAEQGYCENLRMVRKWARLTAL